MKDHTALNILLNLIIGVAGMSAGVYAFHSPCTIENAARAAISSLSIIFGLSTAVTSILMVKRPKLKNLHNDPLVAKGIYQKLKRDDFRTLRRQSTLHTVTILSIILGLVYMVAIKESATSQYTRIIAAAFSISTTISFLLTLFLPNLFRSMIERNAYLSK